MYSRVLLPDVPAVDLKMYVMQQIFFVENTLEQMSFLLVYIRQASLYLWNLLKMERSLI